MPRTNPLAERLIELRRRHGWTQERLADEAGVTARTVQRVEAGEPPSLSTVDALASALRVDVEELMLLRDGREARVEVPASARDLDTLRVVVADDEYWDRRAIQRAWDRCRGPGNLVIFDSGAELKAHLANLDPGTLPALVMLDLHMPKPDGFELLHWLRDIPALQAVPVVVLTGSDDATEIARAYAAGANAVVTKPSSFRDLCAAMTRTIDFWLATAQHPAAPPNGPHGTQAPPA